MKIEQRLKNHYRRWNIKFTYEEEFVKFRNRIISTISTLLEEDLAATPAINQHFFEFFSFHKADIPPVKKAQPINRRQPSSIYPPAYTERGFGDTHIYKSISNCNTPKELATALQILFWTLEKFKMEAVMLKISQEVNKSCLLAPSAGFRVNQKGKQFIVYPNGDDFLDKGIIDCTLSGLEDYPEAARHFENALATYLAGDIRQYRSLLDNLRFSLEQLLKKIFNNNQPLEKQQSCIKTWLKTEHNLHPQLVSLYSSLITAFHQYQNDAVKHNQIFSLDEVEFMIYLTGNFMRLVLQLKHREEDCL